MNDNLDAFDRFRASMQEYVPALLRQTVENYGDFYITVSDSKYPLLQFLAFIPERRSLPPYCYSIEIEEKARSQGIGRRVFGFWETYLDELDYQIAGAASVYNTGFISALGYQPHPRINRFWTKQLMLNRL